ncbi:MAG: hypothetical protein ACRDA8_13525 [Shewanella sp.]
MKKNASSKKALRKQLAHLLSAHLLQMPLKSFKKSKPELKQQLTLEAAQFMAVNDVSLAGRTAQIKQLRPSPSGYSFALRPYKKSPCKSCPALRGKLCKCALKQLPQCRAS